MKRTLAALAALPLLLALAACGGGSDETVSAPKASSPAVTATVTTTPTAEPAATCEASQDDALTLAYEASLGHLKSLTGQKWRASSEAVAAQERLDAAAESASGSQMMAIRKVSLTYLQVANGDAGVDSDSMDLAVDDLAEECGWE